LGSEFYSHASNRKPPTGNTQTATRGNELVTTGRMQRLLSCDVGKLETEVRQILHSLTTKTREQHDAEFVVDNAPLHPASAVRCATDVKDLS